MVKVKLRDDYREFEAGVTAGEIAKSIGAGLYKAVCVCKINGEVKDLRTPVNEDCEVEFLSTTPAMSPEPLEVVFYVVSGNVSGYIYLISDVRLMLWPNAASGYLDKNKNKKSFTIKGDPSINEGDVTCGYSVTAHTQNQIRYNTNIIIGNLENDIKNNQPK